MGLCSIMLGRDNVIGQLRRVMGDLACIGICGMSLHLVLTMSDISKSRFLNVF